MNAPELGKPDRWKLVLNTLKTENLKFTCQFPELGTPEHLNRQTNAEIPRLGKKKQPKKSSTSKKKCKK
jgi:hypothetical protein